MSLHSGGCQRSLHGGLGARDAYQGRGPAGAAWRTSSSISVALAGLDTRGIQDAASSPSAKNRTGARGEVNKGRKLRLRLVEKERPRGIDYMVRRYNRAGEIGQSPPPDSNSEDNVRGRFRESRWRRRKKHGAIMGNWDGVIMDSAQRLPPFCVAFSVW